MSICYTIQAGKRYTINKIDTKVDSVFDKKLFSLNKSYQELAGEYYSPLKIKNFR